MCGISVLVDKKGRAVNPEVVTAMNERVLHRGPDDGGIYVGKSFVLGHRRLSIIDLSPAGHQPMEYRDRSVITYNGEIYNYVEIRAELESQGIEFHTTTDTEVLLAAYDHWGEDCVRHFNGMWAFVIFDRRRNVLFCSRDRFGIKPLQYVQVGDLFAMASEAKQFLAVPGFVARMDPVSVSRFLLDGALSIDDRGFFAGVREVRGGHNLRYDLTAGRFEDWRWYDLSAVTENATLSFSEGADRFRETFFDAVRIRLRSDVAVGSCLSGGVDSSSIVSVARVLTGSTDALRTVFCSWDDPSCDETRYQDVVVRATGFRSIVTRPNIDELLTNGTLDKIIYHQDQPIGGASHFAEYSVFAAAHADKLVVMLDGQGADEYLAGYGEFFGAFMNDQIRHGRLGLAARELIRRSSLSGAPLRRVARSIVLSSVVAPLRARFPKRGNRTVSRSWAGPLIESSREFLEKRQNPESLRELSLLQIGSTSIPYQLHSEDRNSMLHSIESRLPFLDYRLVELGLSLPDRFKIRDGATKAVAREALKGILPDAIRNRHDKLGFPAPEHQWIRNNRDRVRSEIDAAVEAFPEYLAPRVMDRFQLMMDTKAYDPLFFRIVALRRWAEVFSVTD